MNIITWLNFNITSMWIDDREWERSAIDYLPPCVWWSVNHILAAVRERIGWLLDRCKTYYEGVKSRTFSEAMDFIRDEGSSGNKDIQLRRSKPRMTLEID